MTCMDESTVLMQVMLAMTLCVTQGLAKVASGTISIATGSLC